MKKNVMFVLLLLAGSWSCQKHEVSLKNVSSVQPLTDITVANGTAFQDIPLPSHITVKYSDNSTEDIGVVWLQGNYDGSVVATYPLEGTLMLSNGTTNTQSVKAAVKVIVSAKILNVLSVITLNNINVAFNTAFAAVPFPNQVGVTYSDNSTGNVNVTFAQGLYNGTTPGSYILKGNLTLTGTATNTANLQATVTVVVAPLKLKSITQDGVLQYEYFYDTKNRLDHFKIDVSNIIYTYTYSSDNKVMQRLRNSGGNNFPEKYFYHGDGTLDKIEFYASDNTTLGQTHTYTYVAGKISRYDNSDQSIDGLKFRTFEYDGQGSVSKVSFDVGNPWNFTYVTDKNVATPLVLDLADPSNQVVRPVAAFNYVTLSSYTSAYTYNAFGYPTQEVRTFPGNGNATSTILYTYE